MRNPNQSDLQDHLSAYNIYDPDSHRIGEKQLSKTDIHSDKRSMITTTTVSKSGSPNYSISADFVNLNLLHWIPANTSVQQLL